MSGPKSVSYSVSDDRAARAAREEARAARAEARAEARAARAAARAAWEAAEAAARARRRFRREQLQARGATLSRELTRVAEQWREAGRRYGEAFPAWSHGEALPGSALLDDRDLGDRGLDALEASVSGLAGRLAAARREFARQSALFTMRASLREASQRHAADARAAADAAEQERAQQAEEEMRRCADEVGRLLGTLAAEASDEDRNAVEKRAGEAAEEAGAARRKALLAQLRLDVQRANEAAEARRREVEQVVRWRERLAELEGPAVEELDRELRQLVEGGAPPAVPPDMAQRVEDIAARAAEASDRDYALSVITEELGNLGYVVETGFATASAEAPDMLLRKPDMADDYHVSLRAEAGAPMLHARVVREADDPGLDAPDARSPERARTDRDVERAWCRDLAAALAAAGQRGVHGRVSSRHEAGEVPVSTIAPLETGAEPRTTTRRKRKRTTRPKSRVVR